MHKLVFQITLLIFCLASFTNVSAGSEKAGKISKREEPNNSGTVRGRVLDKNTGEVLIGATIYIKESGQGTTTGLDGSFIIRNVPFGTYTIVGSYISYDAIEQNLVLSSNQTEVSLTFSFEPATTQLEEVSVVSQRERKTELSARASEKNSLTVLNVVSARAIEISPDLDVANVVQRISGVTLEKNSSGDAQYAIMRGMDKRYNYTLVNGVKIPSPHNKHRYVPLNMFPSELADRIEVTKSLTADMEGDATGGVINIEMKDAPSSYTFQANTALGYNSYFLSEDYESYPVEEIINKSPRELYGSDYNAGMTDFGNQWGKLNSGKPMPNGVAGLSIGNRFFNKRLGMIFAGNYQNHYKGSSNIYYKDSYSQQQNKVIITEMQERKYSEKQTQYGLHLKSDFRINNTNKIEWYNAYMKMDNYNVRQTTSTNFSLFYDPENGNLDLSYQTRVRTNKQSIFVTSLNGQHALSPRLRIDWSGVYSLAGFNEPEKSYFNLDQITLGDFDNIYPDADGSTREWGFNTDRDLAAYFNLKQETTLFNSDLKVKAGGLYRDKKRANSQVEYRFKPDGNFIKGDNFETLDEIIWYVNNPRGSVGALEYDAHEKIAAGYLLAHLHNNVGDMSLGIRSEYTDQGYFMYFPGPNDDANGGQKYIDILPSLQLKYTPDNKTNWRLSYFKSINRPGFFEVVPYLQITEDYLEFGNKDLKRAKIDNIDMRWEYFPQPMEQIMIGLFYKYLKDPIEISYTTVNRRQFGYGPANLGNAQNLGIEIDMIKYVRNFGFKANYTYTLSSITTPKAYYAMDANDNFALFFKDQKRTLAGQSPHVANLSLLYKDTNHGWDAQVAAAYTHDKIVIASRFLDADYWQSSVLQFDASFEKKLKFGLSIFGKINNIFNTPMYNYIPNIYISNEKYPGQDTLPGKTLIREEVFGRTILLGIRIKNK